MTGFEYLCGLALLLLGFNIGYYEAGKGLKLTELKEWLRPLIDKIRP